MPCALLSFCSIRDDSYPQAVLPPVWNEPSADLTTPAPRAPHPASRTVQKGCHDWGPRLPDTQTVKGCGCHSTLRTPSDTWSFLAVSCSERWCRRGERCDQGADAEQVTQFHL